jgi:hypothetical protein
MYTLRSWRFLCVYGGVSLRRFGLVYVWVVLYRLYLVSDFTRAVEIDCMSICLFKFGYASIDAFPL